MLDRKIATAPVIAAFAIIGISGILMFFHIKTAGLVNMHEIVGLLFVVASILHIIFNWRGFKSYFKQTGTILPMAIVLFLGIGLYFGSTSSDKSKDNPMFALYKTVENAPLDVVAKLYGLDTQEAIKKLQARGFEISDSTLNIQQIAKNHNKETKELFAALGQ